MVGGVIMVWVVRTEIMVRVGVFRVKSVVIGVVVERRKIRVSDHGLRIRG